MWETSLLELYDVKMCDSAPEDAVSVQLDAQSIQLRAKHTCHNVWPVGNICAMQCRSDLGPIGVGSHGEEVRWLPTFADTRHGIMVALRHLCEKSLC
eukprot:4866238-Prymnesium_polylepis.2